MKKHSFTLPLIVDLPGPQLDSAIRQHLAQFPFAGVCLFRRNIESRAQLARLVHDIREVLGHQALVGIDQEGGMVLRLLDGPQAPSPMALGAAGQIELAHAVGAAVGRLLCSVGINWNFAPSLDVNTNPANPIVGERSFGNQPSEVARLGLAWARGLESAGVMAAVKHFPGHGDTHQDSHLTLPVVDKPLEQLLSTELLPFHEAALAQLGSFMTAHIIFPALDPQEPATLSWKILTQLLRHSWGYRGLVVTDGMDMKAITQRYPEGEAAVRALQAGADLVLALGDTAAQVRQAQAVWTALEAGRIEHWQESQQRIAHASLQFAAQSQPYPGEAQDYPLMLQAAQQSITALHQPPLPQPGQKVLLVTGNRVAYGAAYEDALQPQALLQLLNLAFPTDLLQYSDDSLPSCLSALQQAGQQADFVIFASHTRDDLSASDLSVARAVFALGKPALHLALWNPYHARSLGQPALLTYGFRQPTLQALLGVLEGQPARGQLPVAF